MKKIPEEEINEHQGGSYDAHSGFEVCDLFIRRKYDTIKEEMLSYKHEFKDSRQIQVIMEKAEAYLRHSKVIKAIKAKGNSHGRKGEVPPYYDIEWDSPLLLDHLLSIMLYCDYTKHSAAFSSSFRKIDNFEDLQSIKQRNSKYFWMAKRLRETVEIYGRFSLGDKSRDGYWFNRLKGPFFTGIDKVINMPYFHIRLCSPTSTTLHFEVAVKFSGEQGMILRVNNPSRNQRCRLLRGFKVGVVSRYPEEDEVYALCFFVSFQFVKLFSLSQLVHK